MLHICVALCASTVHDNVVFLLHNEDNLIVHSWSMDWYIELV